MTSAKAERQRVLIWIFKKKKKKKRETYLAHTKYSKVIFPRGDEEELIRNPKRDTQGQAGEEWGKEWEREKGIVTQVC